MDKPFLTIDEQIELLRSRGMSVDGDGRLLLMREGYYSLVNGYKGAFIDRQRTSEAGEDRYREGTTLNHLWTLFDLDRQLRELTFPVLVRAETTFRTALAHSFCDEHRGHDAYLDPTSYCEPWEYHNRRGYERDKAHLLRILRRAHDNRAGHASVDHYLGSYGHVPLWVLVNTLTFGNVSHMYALCGSRVRSATCRMVEEAQGVGRIGMGRMRTAISTLVGFRNVCAHDDRLYCARLGRHGEQTFADMLECVAIVLGATIVAEYRNDLSELLSLYDWLPEIQSEALGGMGLELRDGTIARCAGR